jgi:hypothetical protein
MVEAEGSDLINHRVVPTSGINGRQNPGFRTGNGRFISYPCGVESAGVLRTRIGGDARRGVDRVIACRDLASSLCPHFDYTRDFWVTPHASCRIYNSTPSCVRLKSV